MTAFPYLSPWLHCLLRLTPPRGLVHVGAGGGSALHYPFASMPRLLAVEAEVAHHASLQVQLQNHAHCQVVQAVVASQPGVADYYTQSQSNENGLCPAADLQALWPSVKTVRTDQVPTTTLQILLDQEADGATAFNWAVIDCLPAGEVLFGAGALPEAWDVVLVRALKEVPSLVGSSVTNSLTLPSLRQQLSVFGLEFVALEEENHPHVVRALFVRDPTQKLAKENSKLIADCAELARARDELGVQRDVEAQAKTAAIQQRDEQTTLANELQAAFTTLQTKNSWLAQVNSRLIADCAELARARDELGVQKDVEAQAKTAAIQQRDALGQEKAALIGQRDEQSRLATERQAALATQEQDIASKLHRLQQLEAENRELAVRQQMLQDEIIRAEAQIELIKDLLLREPRL